MTTGGRRPIVAVLAAALLLAAAGCASDDPAADRTSTTTSGSIQAPNPEPLQSMLANDLDVIVTNVPEATGVAVALVFDIGSHHDPPGRSGMAHMVEHLLVTSATQTEPARTVDEVVTSYPLGSNAQTGEDYTVIATVVDAGGLEGELTRMAGRLAGVAPTDADLAREEPRLQAELTNMFGAIPELGAANLARERLRPTPDDGRRGGDPDAVAALTLDDLVERLTLYHPGNAHLSVAGPIEPSTTLDMITDHFGAIPGGPAAGDAAVPGTTSPGLHILPVPGSASTRAPGRIAIAYPAPAADDASYPAFLVAAGRLFIQGQQAGFVTSFAPLDDPPQLLIGASLPDGADPTETAGDLHQAVVSVLTADLGPDEGANTALQFGPILGLPGAGAADSYGIAFRAVRAPAVGIDPGTLAFDLASLTDADVAGVAAMLTDHPVTGGAIVIEQP